MPDSFTTLPQHSGLQQNGNLSPHIHKHYVLKMLAIETDKIGSLKRSFIHPTLIILTPDVNRWNKKIDQARRNDVSRDVYRTLQMLD